MALALALIAPATAAASLDDAGYLAFADRIQQRLDPVWDEDAGYYRAGPGGVEPMTNSLVLLTHSVAAMQGHHGPARNDHRARIVARRLVDGLPFVGRRPPGRGDSQVHAPGFVSSMTDAGAPQHLVFDAEVIDGLAVAYRARRALSLPPETARRIRAAIHETANGRFWRWPAIRLNQVNWYALVYAADATVTGNGRLLRRDLALQLRRFFAVPPVTAGAPATSAPACASTTCRTPRRPSAATSIRPSTRASSSPSRASTGRLAAPACRRWSRARGACCASGRAARSPATGRTRAT
jgi:hypothetical protein